MDAEKIDETKTEVDVTQFGFVTGEESVNKVRNGLNNAAIEKVIQELQIKNLFLMYDSHLTLVLPCSLFVSLLLSFVEYCYLDSFITHYISADLFVLFLLIQLIQSLYLMYRMIEMTFLKQYEMIKLHLKCETISKWHLGAFICLIFIFLNLIMAILVYATIESAIETRTFSASQMSNFAFFTLLATIASFIINCILIKRLGKLMKYDSEVADLLPRLSMFSSIIIFIDSVLTIYFNMTDINPPGYGNSYMNSLLANLSFLIFDISALVVNSILLANYKRYNPRLVMNASKEIAALLILTSFLYIPSAIHSVMILHDWYGIANDYVGKSIDVIVGEISMIAIRLIAGLGIWVWSLFVIRSLKKRGKLSNIE